MSLVEGLESVRSSWSERLIDDDEELVWLLGSSHSNWVGLAILECAVSESVEVLGSPGDLGIFRLLKFFVNFK
jgi:hypothetical protein